MVFILTLLCKDLWSAVTNTFIVDHFSHPSSVDLASELPSALWLLLWLMLTDHVLVQFSLKLFTLLTDYSWMIFLNYTNMLLLTVSVLEWPSQRWGWCQKGLPIRKTWSSSLKMQHLNICGNVLIADQHLQGRFDFWNQDFFNWLLRSIQTFFVMI